MASGIGRPRGSAVWDYFDYNEDENKSVCTVISPEGSQCYAKISGKFPTYLRKHLEKSHSEAFKELEAKEQEKKQRESQSERAAKTRKSPVSPQSIESCFLSKKPYDSSSAHYHSISRKLSILIGTSNLPNSLVTNVEFQDFVNELNPRYIVPGRTAMNRELDLLLEELKGKMCSHLEEAGKIAITIDIWTKKGMSESFLGVTAHSFLRKSHQCFIATLAVRRFPQPHTADRVLEVLKAVLHEWGIEES